MKRNKKNTCCNIMRKNLDLFGISGYENGYVYFGYKIYYLVLMSFVKT